MVNLKAVSRLLPVALAWVMLLASTAIGGPPLERGWWAKPQQAAPVAEKAKVAPNRAAVAAKARLDSGSTTPWKIDWNESTGLPQWASGTSRQYPGPPAEIALAFIKDNPGLFLGRGDPAAVNVFSFQVERTTHDTHAGSAVVYFSEWYKRVPVFPQTPGHRGTIMVSVDADGHVIQAGGTLYRIDSLDVTPTLSVPAAIEALRAAAAPDSLTQFGEPTVLIWPTGPISRLAYKISCSVDQGEQTYFYGDAIVDAHSGEVLGCIPWVRDLPRYNTHRPRSSEGTAGGQRHQIRNNVQIQTLPESAWQGRNLGGGAAPEPQHVPFDTTLPRPRPYLRDSAKPGSPPHKLQSALTSSASARPAADGWFYSASFYHDRDWDYDGYDSRAIIEWDAETHVSELVVHVLIYGRDMYGQPGALCEYAAYVRGRDLRSRTAKAVAEWISTPYYRGA